MPSTSSSPPEQSPDAISALLVAGRRLHRHLLSASPHLMSDSVLTMYSSYGSPSDSRRIFNSLPRRNLFQWNAMISAYSRNDLWDEVLALFSQLMSLAPELLPDNFTLPCVLKSCTGISDLKAGRGAHGVAVKMGLSSDVFVSNSLMSYVWEVRLH